MDNFCVLLILSGRVFGILMENELPRQKQYRSLFYFHFLLYRFKKFPTFIFYYRVLKNIAISGAGARAQRKRKVFFVIALAARRL